ncbi:MAG: T9SS type A sorting domain-containing protein [Flavobacteriales bacterium]|nr:T9SS type A sorting domain-containing protein [Flavobacteriales bacterium]
MKKLFPFILFLGFANNLAAQTNVSGLIFSNVEWNLAGSPYIVTGNIVVQSSVRLTIEPGVEVKFNAGTAIQISGELVANGTPESRIVFTSNSVLASGAWLKIQFVDSSIDGVSDADGNYVSGSVLRYCDILYGGGSGTGTGAISINAAKPFVNNCNILYSGGDGVYVYGSDPNFSYCNIRNSNGKGINFASIYHADCIIRLEHDSIENNAMGGIFFGYEDGACTNTTDYIRNNYFHNNHGHGAIWAEYALRNAEISQNHFSDNSSPEGGALHILGINNSIRCNLFQNNESSQGGAIYLFNTSHADQTFIENNVFQGNRSSQAAAIFINYIIANGISSSVYITDNILRNNISNSGMSIYIKGNTGNGIGNINTDFQIKRNQFIANNSLSVLQLYYFKGEIKDNSFLNSGATYEIYNDNTSGAPDISADSNYWGTSNTQHIDDVIYDFFDDANQTFVNYHPILSASIQVDTTCIPFPTSISDRLDSQISAIVFPNPFSFKTEISFDQTLKDATFYLHNIYGQQLTKPRNINGKQIPVFRDNLPQGIYIFEVIQNKKRISSGKLIID